MKQQTAVEWLVNQLDLITNDTNKYDDFRWVFEEEIKQAKQMEKDQLFEFWNGGINSTKEGGKSFDQFYEIYNK